MRPNTPQRCLIVTQQLSRNGTETFIMNLFRNIDRSKLMFDFLLEQNKHDGYYQEAIELGSQIFEHKYSRKNVFKYYKELSYFFKQNSKKYCAVYFHGTSFTSISAIDFAKKYNIPIRIVHSHGSTTYGIHNKILHYFNRVRIAKIANKFLACSDKSCNWGYKHSSAYKRCEIINNGISIEAFRFNKLIRDKKRKELNIGEELVLGCVGRLTEVKNPFFSLEILYDLVNNGINAKLIFIGDGELREGLKNKTKELALQKYVVFLGARNDVPELMQALDALLLPSFSEGFPFVVIEAQASNLPIFVSSSITPSIKLSKFVYFIPIKDGPRPWSKLIKTMKFNRLNGFMDERLKAYDIKNIANYIQNIILSNCSNDTNIS